MLEFSSSYLEKLKTEEAEKKNRNYTKEILKNSGISALETAAGYGVGRLVAQYF
jgi:hypothetical protein